MTIKLKKNLKAFSLLEVVVTVGILSIVIAGLLQLFIYGQISAEESEDLTRAMIEAQGKMEEIRDHSFAQIAADYISGGTPGDTFALNGVTGSGLIYLDASNADLIQVDIVISFQTAKNRIIGEDVNFNGDLDMGEDFNGNGRIDSTANLSSLVARR